MPVHGGFLKNFTFYVACALFALMEHHFLLVLVSGSHFLCVRVLLEEFTVLDSWGDDAIHGGFWKNFSHFLWRGGPGS